MVAHAVRCANSVHVVRGMAASARRATMGVSVPSKSKTNNVRPVHSGSSTSSMRRGLRYFTAATSCAVAEHYWTRSYGHRLDAIHVQGLRWIGKLNAFPREPAVYFQIDVLMDVHVDVVVGIEHVVHHLDD